MARMIQIRNVPEAIHRKLKARAALEGMSLSDYLLEEIRILAREPSLKEWLRELEKQEPLETALSAAEIIRDARGPIPK